MKDLSPQEFNEKFNNQKEWKGKRKVDLDVRDHEGSEDELFGDSDYIEKQKLKD